MRIIHILVLLTILSAVYACGGGDTSSAAKLRIVLDMNEFARSGRAITIGGTLIDSIYLKVTKASDNFQVLNVNLIGKFDETGMAVVDLDIERGGIYSFELSLKDGAGNLLASDLKSIDTSTYDFGSSLSLYARLIHSSPVLFQLTGAYSFLPGLTGYAFTGENLPSWAALDASTGELSGYAQAGIYEDITITGTSGTKTAQKTFTLTILSWFLNETGWSGCWDASGTSIPCTGTGLDGEYRMGLPINFQRDNDNNFVVDNVHGLIWQDDTTGTDMNWANANAYCNSLSLGVYVSGWRVPTAEEAESLIDYYQTNKIPAEFTYRTGYDYWTASDNPNDLYFALLDGATEQEVIDMPALYDYVWVVSGNYLFVQNKNMEKRVRCVYGTSQPAASFSRNDTKETVTDLRTGLMWQDDSGAGNATGSVASAVSYCENLTSGGYSDWRLPNMRELVTITYKSSASMPAVYPYFMNMAVPALTGGRYRLIYWSSTEWETGSNYYYDKGMYLDFYTGESGSDSRETAYNVRCVRGGTP